MNSKVYLYLTGAVWIVWLLFVIALVSSEKITDAMVVTKTGFSINAHCVVGKSVKGVKFLAKYDDEDTAREDFVNLPRGITCSEGFLSRFNRKRIEIGVYKNHYFGMKADGYTIRHREDDLRKFNDKRDVIIFAFVLAAVASFYFLMKRYHLLKGAVRKIGVYWCLLGLQAAGDRDNPSLNPSVVLRLCGGFSIRAKGRRA